MSFAVQNCLSDHEKFDVCAGDNRIASRYGLIQASAELPIASYVVSHHPT